MERSKLMFKIFEGIGSIGKIMSKQCDHSDRAKAMLSGTQLRVMFCLAQHGSLNVKQFAEMFGISSSAVTQMVDGLVKEGWLERKADAGDRRKVDIVLTVKGEKRLAEAKEKRFEKLKLLFEPLDDRELLQLSKIHQKIIDHYNE